MEASTDETISVTDIQRRAKFETRQSLLFKLYLNRQKAEGYFLTLPEGRV
ncbi:MAG: hypothetical protein LBC91_02575 [Candidatus Accumulibacter sp.]|jgi:hypothetical protein|nr:hypothetical protein [Accumulibacter sp.]